ncbi:MAG: anti-sigma factor [Deinococcus sp.]|uniref:anti-sigma factor n=1 Tax=Deinococcus sp. TaxID=47478 RepID=UPI0026DCE282|nr:anti-sigma factor [Deinococcus sp.]MDO4247154.1 anti-sigma factor [Deinococcus sp.]
MNRQELLALALGQLGESEQQRAQLALDQNPELRAALRQDLEALTHLLDDLDLQAIQISPQAPQNLLSRVRSEPPTLDDWVPATPVTPVSSPAVSPGKATSWLLPAGLALVLGLGMAMLLRPNPDLPARYAASPGARSFQAEGAEGQVGRLVRLSDGRVYVHMERALEAGRTYQLWRLLPGEGKRPQPRSLGVFESGIMTHAMPRSAVLAVSVEPPGGSEAPSSPLLFKQRLR